MISRFNVIYSPEAKNDLRSIASYILFELKAPQAAQNVTTRIRNEIRSLEEMPERYPIVEWEAPFPYPGQHHRSQLNYNS